MVYPVMVPSLLKVGFHILLPFILFSFLVHHAMSSNRYIRSRCSVTANYTNGSAFEVNMRSLFSTFTKESLPTGFSNATVGEGSDTVYGLVQCRGDMGQDSCKECIHTSTQQVVPYCPYNMDAIIWYEQCQLRYSNTNFFGHLNVDDSCNWFWVNAKVDNPKAFNENLGSLLKNLTYQATTEPSRFMFATGNIPYTDLQTIYGLVQCTGDTSLADCSLCLSSTRSKIATTCGDAHGCEIAMGTLRKADANDGATLDLATVRAATNDFAPRNKLGEGGFGAVYRGQLPDGQEIAVKRLSRNTGHGPKQFNNEVQTLTKLQHRNLVRLLGGFMEAEEKILVYEYVRNTSLDNFLFGEPMKRMQLDWPVRFKLINGIARGLLYLHEDSRLRIVHRDLKASNVLLDEDMNPKISDFGTAKIFDTNQTQADTFEIMGTRLWGENSALQVVDEILEGTCDENEILRCIHIGLLCVQQDAPSRPRMSKVVAMLENSSVILPSILPPAPPIWNIRSISVGPQTSSTISGTGSEHGSSTY
ncbi:G-type lectin S-receptor-like serine/threonine-protein kinase SD3-1 [Nymphaea thermarum]|nr:G-type lectin S-receptor-like serine/threonine-protein kinase SD3-1 [Nymphaea thermarum]